MVRLAIVRGLSYTDIGQVQRRWLIPTYATVFRWTGNRTDAEDLTSWIFHNIAGNFRAPEMVQVIEERLAELTAEAIARHWSERYSVAGVNANSATLSDSRSTLESLLTNLTAEMHLTLVLRFLRRRSTASIASQLGLSVREADGRVFEALIDVAERIGFQTRAAIPTNLGDVSAFVTDLVARRRATRFDVSPGTWPALVAACHVQAAVAGNDLPTQRFVRSLEPSTRRLVTELRIWSA